MIPDERLSEVPVTGAFLSPDGQRPVAPPLQGTPRDWEMGGSALNDSGQGLQVQVWEFYLSGEAIMVKPDNDQAITLYQAGAGVTEVTGCFDSNMNPTIAWVQDGAVWMRWWDPTLPGYNLSTFPGATSPRLTLDDKRYTQDANRDILLFYVLNGALYYRMQRQRYLNENWLINVPAGYSTIGRVGMTEGFRVQIELLSWGRV